ncbi:MAG TPA: hypothetical protein VGB47_05580, partial [Thermoanaerobaculia bacterium]
QEADVPQRAAQVEDDLLPRRPGKRENVAVALAPLPLGRGEPRDAVQLFEILVGIKVVSEQGVRSPLATLRVRSPLATLRVRLPPNDLLLASSVS